MKVEINSSFFTDDTNQCDKSTYFVKTTQNTPYLDKIKEAKGIVSVEECIKILNVNDIKIIGITGTNGKTTTAAAIYSMLLDLDKKVAMQGTRGFFINTIQAEEKSLTTPPILQTLYHIYLAKQQKCEFFVMEVSSHAISQKRIEGLEFALKIFTNLSQDHLDFHKSIEEYARVKSSFFSDDGLKLINKDDKYIQFNPKGARTYGIENTGTYKINAYSLKDGIDGVLVSKDKSYNFHSSLRGFFNLYNLTCAISAIDLLVKTNEEDIAKAIENFGGVSGRMEVVHVNPTVIVDFAHTPDGMEKVLEAMKSESLVVLFGAGGDRDKTKRPLMAKVASRYGQKVYITSDNPRTENMDSIIEDIKKGLIENSNVVIQKNRKKAIHEALKNLKTNQTLMILGKGDETYQEINGIKHPFDDREIVREFYL